VTLPLLLAGRRQEALVRRRWWQWVAYLVFAMAALLVIISPARPLFPVNIFLRAIPPAAAQRPFLARIETVYTVYRDRHDAFAPVRVVWPSDLKVLGLIAFDSPETSLWRPFGSRRVVHVCPGLEYILVRTEGFEQWFGCSPDVWVQRMQGRVVQKIPMAQRAADGTREWYWVKLN
jgi:hypothetical protein